MPRPKDERLVYLPEAEETGEDTRHSRFLAWLLASFIFCLALAAGLNLWLNPWGDYGRSGYFSVYNDRLAKTEYLKSLPKKEIPRTLIIGSSVAMSPEPEFIEKRYGGRTFNLGTFWSSMDEAWCWLQFFEKDLGITPKRIILCLETRGFASPENGPLLFPDKRRRLLNAPDLAKHLPGYSSWRHLVSKTVDALSWQQLKIGLEMARKKPRQTYRSLLESGFLSNGAFKTYLNENPKPKFPRRVNNFYRGLATGRFKAGDKAVEARRRELLAEKLLHPGVARRYFPGSAFAADKVKLFWEFMETCRADNIELILIINPIHPYFLDQLNEYTAHPARLARLKKMMLEAAAKYPNIREVINGHRVESFGGDPARFYDHLHPSPSIWRLAFKKAPRMYQR